MFRLATLPLALIALTTNAHASHFLGNPTTELHIDHSGAALLHGSVWLDKVTVNYCDGTSEDHDADQAIDPVGGFEFAPSSGLACSITVHWGSNVELDGVGAAGDFGLESWDLTTQVELSGAVQSAPLGGWSVVSGNAPSGTPELVVSFEE